MNPLMRGFGMPLQKMQNMMNVMNQVQQLKSNPASIPEFLKNSGQITTDQYNAIKNMNNPTQIGQYLMNNVPPNMQGQVQQSVQNIGNQMNKR